jgi:mannose-6-phosphate isomerase-like protein (cupin superfamily)
VPSWRFAHIDELERPDPPTDPDFTEEERERARAELRRRPAEQEARNAEVAGKFPDFGTRWRQIRRVFGITSFGASANEADAGEPLIIPHDESEHGQEELYVVMRGRAQFECDGDTMEGGAGAMLYVPPGTLRAVTAVEDGTLLLMLGGRPGTYEPPIWARDWRPPREWLERRRA